MKLFFLTFRICCQNLVDHNFQSTPKTLTYIKTQFNVTHPKFEVLFTAIVASKFYKAVKVT